MPAAWARFTLDESPRPGCPLRGLGSSGGRSIARFGARWERIATGSMPARSRIGVHAGELVYGIVGAPSRITCTGVCWAAADEVVARIDRRVHPGR